MSRIITCGLVVLFALPLAAQEQDSVLVALAKRTGRLGKVPKTHVITNDEVAAIGGHVSWAESDSTSANGVSANNPAPAHTEWSLLQHEHDYRLQRDAQLTPPPPPPPSIEGTSRASYSSMPSSATNATVRSSSTNATPYATANAAYGQSTASSSTAASTASNSTPRAVPGRKPD